MGTSPFWAYWYFHLPNFVLAALMYTLFGRALLGLVVQPEDSNYIWRAFCRLTDPVVKVVALVTPKAAADVVIWLFGVVWLFWLRVLLLYAFVVAGLAPQGELSSIMERHWYYIGIAFFGMINGMFHPLRVVSYIFSKVLMTVPLFGSEALIFFFSSLMLSTATIILAGIPAAIYERFTGAKDDSTDLSLWIWLAGTAILTIPALGNFFRIGL